jgi:hypothetical protein
VEEGSAANWHEAGVANAGSDVGFDGCAGVAEANAAGLTSASVVAQADANASNWFIAELSGPRPQKPRISSKPLSYKDFLVNAQWIESWTSRVYSMSEGLSDRCDASLFHCDKLIHHPSR